MIKSLLQHGTNYIISILFNNAMHYTVQQHLKYFVRALFFNLVFILVLQFAFTHAHYCLHINYLFLIDSKLS